MGKAAPACDGLPCADPGRLIPADSLRVAEPPANGRVVIRGNGFAHVPNPGFAGEDAFRIEGWSAKRGGTALNGRVAVMVRAAR